MKTIEIDGSYGEGGGQIIRTSLSLAAITKQSVTIHNIRSNRPNPGLQAQHLTAATAVNTICNGELDGALLNNTEFRFSPGNINAGSYEFNVGTAGSTILVAQTLMPILLHAAQVCSIRIIGGTHVIKSPSYDYFEQIFLPAIRLMNAKVKCKLLQIGFYPKGGGIIEISTAPSNLQGCCSWSTDKRTNAIIRLACLPIHIAIREKNILLNNGIENVTIDNQYALSAGNAIIIWQGLRGACSLGKRGKKAEIVAEEALEDLKQENAEVDRYLADQLLVYAALSHGKSAYKTSKITEHLRTNAYIITQFTNKSINIDHNYIMAN